MEHRLNLKSIKSEELSFFKKHLIKLYLQSFTEGEFAQFISEKDAEKEWEKYFEIGEIYVALQDQKLASVLVAYPLKYDENLPKQSIFDVEKSIYIAELMTDSMFQTKGIGTKLMNFFTDNINKNQYDNIVIRVWNENIPAISLYRKLSFQDIGISILQTKQSSENEIFKMKKIYLRKLIEK